MLRRAVALGEALEHGHQTDREQMSSLEGVLVAEQMQFNQKFVSDPAVQGGNDVGKGLMKGALAVCNRLCASQRACSLLEWLRP